MQALRMYTGPDGQTHFEELKLDFDISQEAQRTEVQEAHGIQFVYQPPGFVIDWHPAPRRQYVVTLQGQAEIGVGDGTTLRFGPGDVLLAEDLTGQGHVTRVVGEVTRISAQISI